jgi:hypothetical protein
LTFSDTTTVVEVGELPYNDQAKVEVGATMFWDMFGWSRMLHARFFGVVRLLPLLGTFFFCVYFFPGWQFR